MSLTPDRRLEFIAALNNCDADPWEVGSVMTARGLARVVRAHGLADGPGPVICVLGTAGAANVEANATMLALGHSAVRELLTEVDRLLGELDQAKRRAIIAEMAAKQIALQLGRVH